MRDHPRTNGAAMLALADPPPPTTTPHAEPDPIPGLKHTPEWHRAQEIAERAWLDAYMRWTLKYGRRPLHGLGGTR